MSPVHGQEWPGDGLTFLCLHAVGVSHVHWSRVGPGLACHDRVLAPDLVGFGRTPRGPAGAGLDAQQAMVGSILVQDRPVPVEYARSVAAARPDWRLHVFDELGHLPQLEAPDAWLAITVDWLAETRLLHTAAPSQR